MRTTSSIILKLDLLHVWGGFRVVQSIEVFTLPCAHTVSTTVSLCVIELQTRNNSRTSYKVQQLTHVVWEETLDSITIIR